MDFRRVLGYGKGTLEDILEKISKGKAIYTSGNDFVRMTLDKLKPVGGEQSTGNQIKFVASLVGEVVNATYDLYKKLEMRTPDENETLDLPDGDDPITVEMFGQTSVNEMTKYILDRAKIGKDTDFKELISEMGIEMAMVEEILESNEGAQFMRDIGFWLSAFIISSSGSMEVADEREEVTEVNVPDENPEEFDSKFQDAFKMEKWFNVLRE